MHEVRWPGAMLLLFSMCLPGGLQLRLSSCCTAHLGSFAAVQIVTAWNGMGIAAFAEAAMVLKQEQPAATRDFPVEGCDPSEYQTAAIKVLAWLSAVFTQPAREVFSAVLVGYMQQPHRGQAWLCSCASPAALATLLVFHLMPCCLSCIGAAESCKPL